MKLDYNEARGLFTLHVPRGELDIGVLKKDHGLDFSMPASTPDTAVLFTREPYAAVAFYAYGTDRARDNLAVIQSEIERSYAKDSSRHFAVPADKELWPFQKANLDYALRRDNTLVGDEPGLGKTETAIAYCNERQAKRNLVICPANIRLQWEQRIREWSTMRLPVIYPILKSSHGTHPKANWTITSYDLARTVAIGSLLSQGEYDTLILDEPHYLKEATSQRTRAIFGGGSKTMFAPIASRAKNILGLTGTPLPNRPREAYTLARGLCFDSIDWMSEEKFRLRFNPSMTRQVVGSSGEVKTFIDERTGRFFELQARLRANFMTRHEKHGPNGVMSQLHFPIYDLVRVEEDTAVKAALAAEKLLDIDPEDLEGADMKVLGHIAVVRHQMGLALAPHVAEYARMCIEGGEEKIVIFAWHIDVLDIIEHRLSRLGVLRIDGRTGPTQKQQKVNQFKNDPRKHIMLGNTLSMGTGTDGLQEACSHALLAEPDWTPGVNQQAFDRLDRGGQREQVQGDIFVAPNSIAEKILAQALRKGQNIHKTLDARI